MTDIVERLKNNKICLGHGNWDVDPLSMEAVTEIETLRQKIRMMFPLPPIKREGGIYSDEPEVQQIIEENYQLKDRIKKLEKLAEERDIAVEEMIKASDTAMAFRKLVQEQAIEIEKQRSLVGKWMNAAHAAGHMGDDDD